MAEGWLRQFAEGRAEIYSAGLEAHGLHPKAVAAMKEVGIDISHHTSKTIDSLSPMQFEIVITVCDNAREHCPYFPASSKQLHHDFPDPAKVTGTEEEIMEAFRFARDEIKHFCQQIVIKNLH
jgi:arsenate reductase (thioredoxin)